MLSKKAGKIFSKKTGEILSKKSGDSFPKRWRKSLESWRLTLMKLIILSQY